MNNYSFMASSPVASTDIGVKIWTRLSVHWVGTKAQLIAEGLIQEGFDFPPKYAEATFTRDGFDFRVRRHRPRDLKGPRRLLMDLDLWCVISNPVQCSRISPRLHERQQQLAAQIFRESPAGERQFFRHLNARSDAAFQAFLAVTTGFVSKRRAA